MPRETPEAVAKVDASHTGQFLKKVLEQVGYLPPLLRGAVGVESNRTSEKPPKPAKKRKGEAVGS